MKKYRLTEQCQIENFNEVIQNREFEVLSLEDILKEDGLTEKSKENISNSYNILLSDIDFVGLIKNKEDNKFAFTPIYRDEIILIQSEKEKEEFMVKLYKDYVEKNKGTKRMNIFKGDFKNED